MDKRIIFAVAGSGKTSHIIDGLEEDSRALILTYTDNNTRNLKDRIIAKFGYIPIGIKVYKYFTFLYSFCFKPILGHKVIAKGISWDQPPRFAAKSSPQYFQDKGSRLYGNRIAKLLFETEAMPELIKRIEKYFDYLYIDEVQDFAGNDFNFLCSLSKTYVNQMLVGDFYQHTFDTSRDGNINGSLHDNYKIYLTKFSEAGFTIDFDTLSHSHRCSPTVCLFISEQIGIDIESHRDDETDVRIVDSPDRAEQLYYCNKTIKLFYQASNKYKGFVDNWGAVKGVDCYDDVCVVLNPKTLKHFQNSDLKNLAPQTKNKLYVACTRAKQNLYFVSEAMYKSYKK
jgi:hypothetical protein